jgi:hypothetical protein
VAHRRLVATLCDGREVLQVFEELLKLANRKDDGFPVALAIRSMSVLSGIWPNCIFAGWQAPPRGFVPPFCDLFASLRAQFPPTFCYG